MNELIVIGNFYDETNKTMQGGRVYSGGGIAPTIAASHFGQEKWILVKVKQNTQQGYAECEEGGVVNLAFATSNSRRGRVIEHGLISPTVMRIEELYRVEKYRIRKLTPKEAWRLMDFDDIDYENASKVCSDSKLYQQAGNSIVVGVMEQIFKEML